MTFFEPDPKHETPMDDHDQTVLDNWNRLSEDIRSRCVDLLRSKTPSDMMGRWKDQHARRIRIGSDDPWFHMGIGMQVRNAMRSILKDDELPFVKYDDGNEYQNWDDFYGGALQQLITEPEDILYSPVGGYNGSR